MAINFLVKKGPNEALGRVKRLTVTVTTIVLVGYVVAAAAIGGFGWYQSKRNEKVSTELIDLNLRVTALVRQEAMVNRYGDRVEKMAAFLDGRRELNEELLKLVDLALPVSAWSSDQSGVQQVTLKAAGALDIDAYAKILSNSFSFVRIDTVAYRLEEGLWTAVISLSGRKI